LKEGFDVITYDYYEQLVVITIGCISVIYVCKVLLDYRQFEKASIEEKVTKEKIINDKVSEVAMRLFSSFAEVRNKIISIGEKINDCNILMQGIADSSEKNSADINNQMKMTNNIQIRIDDTSSNAEKVKETTDYTLELINEGNMILEHLINQSKIVDKDTKSTWSKVELLKERVEEVTSITDTILNISSQTNLLALNASIEAARAGVAGRGFAVVADEIRVLSEETRKSAAKITEIVNELSSVMEDTISDLENSTKSIKKQNEMVSEVSVKFDKSGEAINRLNDMVDTIHGNIRDINDSNIEILGTINQLSATGEEVASNANQGFEANKNIESTIEQFTEDIEAVAKMTEELSEIVV
ncbi:MAG: hypothetical protein K6G26_00915, partial [Lachnospiraceae bacterium]|nr:hypothetical protein [Lachnospiraceae bacterium]